MRNVLTPVWKCPSENPTLVGGDVHVWSASLAQPSSEVGRLWTYLAPDERERANQFYFPEDRSRWIVSRGVVREILSQYVSLPPAAIAFEYNQYGKPALAGRRTSGLQFNLAHSDDHLLLALVHGRSVGMDIERIRHDVSYEEIAQCFFARDEVDRLRSLPASARAVGFFNCWTRKEAYIKARGEGLSRRLGSFSVTLSPDAPVALECGDDRWQLWAIDVGDDYAAGLVIEGDVRTFAFWYWPSNPGALSNKGWKPVCAS